MAAIIGRIRKGSSLTVKRLADIRQVHAQGDTIDDTSLSASATLSSAYCHSHMVKTSMAGTQLLPVRVVHTVGVDHQEGTTLHIQRAGFKTGSDLAKILMDKFLDSGYTICVKTETPDMSEVETLQTVAPRCWTVDDHGVLQAVSAEGSEVIIKVEKPDWTTETETVDCIPDIVGEEDTAKKEEIEDSSEERVEAAEDRGHSVFRD
ncbi:hypothetical protein LSAT2_028597 [Lamellibrachia satsuma]|nr:hypothetical protein LSAT2_028597 [Lamellibrachia satsuma]